jgi:hypothetical protein
MKLLILKILLFLLLLIGVVYLIPIDRRQRFLQLKDDCSAHAIWVYDRIHSNTKPVDIVFLGSSHTINGIRDDSIGKQLKLSSLHVANFGYCRYGMNLYPVLLKEILSTKKPRIVILEVREDENRYSHPVFPYLADAKDVFLAYPFFNRDLVRDYFDAFLYRLKLLKVQYFRQEITLDSSDNDFGFMGSADTVSKTSLEKAKEEKLKPKSLLTSFERFFYMTYPRYYLEKLANLCKENNIRLVFLYLPEYGSTQPEPIEMTTYKKYGTVLIPPLSIFDDPDNWADDNHLNHAGAGKLSKWVGGQI